MFLISDEVIDSIAGTRPIGAEQVKRWLKAERDIYQVTIRAQQESIGGYLSEIDRLTNYDYEARIDELSETIWKLDVERLDWMAKYNELKSALVELVG